MADNTIEITGTGGIIEGNLATADVNVNLDSALSFDSNDDKITTGNLGSLGQATSLSSFAWVKLDATPSTSQYIWSTIYAPVNFVFSGATGLRFQGKRGDTDALASIDSSGPFTFTTGDWYHVGFTYDNSSRAVLFYINGVQYAGGTFPAALKNVNTDLILGNYGAGTNMIQGNLADVKIFNSVVSATDAKILAAKINQDPTLTSANANVIGWWKINEGTGTTINDFTNDTNGGTDHNGTLANGTWQYDQYSVDVYDNSTTTDGTFTVTQGKVEGKALSCLTLDGNGDHVDLASSFTMSHDGSSVAVWVKKDNATGNEDVIIGQASDANQHWLKIDTNGDIILRDYPNDLHCDTAITDTNWHHIVVTLSGDSNGAIYVDGVAQTISANAIVGDPTFDVIGIRGTIDEFDGRLRDLKVFDYALSAEQAASLCAGHYPVTPKYWWKCDEGGGSSLTSTGTATAINSSSFGGNAALGDNNGTLDLDGNLTIAANGSLSLPRGNLDLASNIDVNCTTVATQFIHNNGKVVLSSTSSENELYTGGATFYNVDKTGSVRARLFENMTVENVLDMTSSTSYFDLDADGGSTSFTLTMGTATSSGTIESHDAGRFRLRTHSSRLITVQGVSTLYPCNVTGNDWDWDATIGAAGVQLANMDFQVDVVTNDGGVKITLTGDCEFDALTVSDGDTFDVNGHRVEFGGDVTYLSGSTFDADGLMVFSGGFTKYGTLNNAASSDILSFSSSGTPTFSYITGYRTFFAGAGVQLGTGGFTNVTKAIIAGNLLTGTRDPTCTNFSLASGGTYDANDNTLTVSGDFNSAGGLIGKSAGEFVTDDGGTNHNFILAGSNANSDGWTNFTVECWVKLDHMGKMGSESTFFSRGSNSLPKVGTSSSNTPRLYGGSSSKALNGNTTLTTDRWYHLAYTYNNSTGATNIYVNGKLDASATIDTGIMTSDVSASMIGAQQQGNRAMDGLMGKISVWNHELTQAEIRKLMFMTGAEMQADNTNFPDATANDCKFFYNFDEGTGSTVADSGPGGNNGTWGHNNSGTAAVWAANGTYTRDTSTLVMSGAAGTLTHGHGQTFYNLTLAPSGGDTTVTEVRGAGYDIVIEGLLTCGGGTLNNVGSRSRFQLDGTVNFGGTSFTNVPTLIVGSDLFTIPYKTGTTAQTFAALSIRAETELNGDIIVTGAFDYGGSNESLRTRGYDCTFNGSTTQIGSGHTFKAEAGTVITMGNSNGWVNSSGTMQLWGENAAAFPAHASNTLSTANATPLQFGTGDFSISFWYKSNDNWDREHQILGNANFYLHLNNAGASAEKLRAYMGDAYVDTGAFNSARLHQNWNHIVATFDRTDLLKVYVNGSYEANVDISGKSGQDIMNSGNLTIGEANATSGRGWNGSLVDLRFFKGTVLTDGSVSVGQAATGNIATLYNSGLNPATHISSNGEGGNYASDSPTATSWWKLGNTNASGARATAPALDLTDSSSGSSTLSNAGGVKAGSIFMTKSSGAYSITDSNDTLIMNWRNCKINMNANTELYVSSASQFSGRITLD